MANFLPAFLFAFVLTAVAGFAADGRGLASSKAAEQEAKQKYGLTEEEISAIRDYTGPNSFEINSALRNGGAQLRKMKGEIELLQSALEKLPALPAMGPLLRIEDTRGMPPAVRAAVEDGSQIDYGFFLSTSAGGLPKKNGNTFYAMFAGPGGRNIGSLSSLESENEILFMPGRKFRVIARQKRTAPWKSFEPDDGYFLIVVEVDRTGLLVGSVPKQVIADPEAYFERHPEFFPKPR